MAITSHSTGLNVSLFGGAGLSLPVVIKVLLLLALFAAFFSAVLLAITSYARSFKEAQAYIIPLMLLCLVPGVICLMPSLAVHGPAGGRAAGEHRAAWRAICWKGASTRCWRRSAVMSTVFYVVAAIGVAARIFGTDAILYGSQSTWSDIFRRPTEPRAALPLPAAALSLAIMFPAYFVLSATLAQSREISLDVRLFVGAIVTVLVFCGIPWVDRAVQSRALAQRHGLGAAADGVAPGGGDVGPGALAGGARVVPAQRADRHHRRCGSINWPKSKRFWSSCRTFRRSGSCWRWRSCRACARSSSFAACCFPRCGR